MKTFVAFKTEQEKDQFVEKLNEQFLAEGGLSRIFQHLDQRNVGIITAFRSRYTLNENKARNRQLRADIKAAGYGVYEANGHYIEGFGSEHAQDSFEEVFFVIGDPGNDDGRLKGLLIKWGEKYNQDSVLYKEYGYDKAVLIGTQDFDEDGNSVPFPGKGKKVQVGDWHPQKIGQFYTKMRGKTFVFESIRQAQGLMGLWSEYAVTNQQVILKNG